MDYRSYQALMERYNALSEVAVGPEETRGTLIKKLMDNSYEKKQIASEANAIIKEFVTKYEQNPDLLDGATAAALEDILNMLTPESAMILDLAIALRVSRLLLAYYQHEGDLEHTVLFLSRCAYFDIFMKSHLDDYDSTPYSILAEQYLDDFDKLSEAGKTRLAKCWLNCVVNRKDRTFAVRKFPEIYRCFAEFRQKMGPEFALDYYSLQASLTMEMGTALCLDAEYARSRGLPPDETAINPAQFLPQLEAYGQEQGALLADEETLSRVYVDPIYTRIGLAKLDYHLGRISVEELLQQFRDLSVQYTEVDHCGALFLPYTDYLRYLYKSSHFDRQYMMDEGRRVVEYVLGELDQVRNENGPIVGMIAISHYIIDFMSAASAFVEFDLFKDTVLNATVYSNKALYVHTMMVKEICLAILSYIIDHDPRYLDGVAGYDWEYCFTHKQEIMELMENCALFHDIGKFFCMDIVSNSSRSLTDDEFVLIQSHPHNFSSIYHGGMGPAVRCIRDCAELHHRWYNEAGGYPREKHTFNKPFVNILTVADCIDAATDNIGRPYGLGKTFAQVREEFDRDRDTRYSGYISELLHVEEIQRQIEYIIGDRRMDIYCDIYLGMNEKGTNP